MESQFTVMSEKLVGMFAMPHFKAGEKAISISGLYGFEKLSEPSDPASLICPRCGGSKGYKLVDPEFKIIWVCEDFDCHPKKRDEQKIPPYEDLVFSDWKPPILSMSDFDIPYLYRDANIEKCKNLEAKNFFSQWSLEPKGFVLLVGSSGRGKTYAACAAIDVYRKNFKNSAKFINISNLNMIWKDRITDKRSELELIRDLQHKEFLILDDLGIRTPSEAFLDFLYVLINERIEKEAATIVTTNLNSKDMSQKLGDAITSRLCSGKIIKFEGKDQRIIPDF